METNLQHLIDVLQEQMGLMDTMVHCLAAERDAVIGGDREVLEREVARKEQLVQQIREAEARRQRQVEAVSASLEIKDQTVTMELLVAEASPSWSHRLQTCRDELRRQVRQVQEANQANQTLVTQSLDLVAGSLQMLGELPPDNGTYGAGGKVTDPAPAGRLLKGSA